MDAVKFFKTLNRLCNQDCKKCPVCKDGVCMVVFDNNAIKRGIKETISKVEQWAKEHPEVTRKSEFLKMFPNADLKNITRLLPCALDRTLNPLRCVKYGYLSPTCRCDRCRDDYWNEELTDDD